MLIETEDDPKQPGPAVRRARNRWHAVNIVPAAGACGAAVACKGKRYLSMEAPRLPLAACDASRCDCKYRHFDDRRGAPRRAQERGGPAARVTSNRREKRGRRATD